MIQNRVKISVIFDRKHQATRRDDPNPHTGLIQMKIFFKGKYLYFAIASVYADEFGRRVKGRIVGDTVHGRADAEIINQRILDLRRNILNEIERCNRLQVPFSLEYIDPKAKGRNDDDFLQFARDTIQRENISEATKKGKIYFINTLERFGRIRSFQDLTTANITLFDQWLQQQHRKDDPQQPAYTAAYRHNIHTNIHRYISDAIRLNIITDDPYQRFQIPHGHSKPRLFLSEAQVQQIAAFKADDVRSKCQILEASRDLFLIQCFTGMSFADIMSVNWQATRESLTITTTRIKTRTQYTIKFLPPVIRILESYDFNPPRLTYSGYSRALKFIARAVGLNVPITSHTGRHTFATTFGLRSGVPIEILSKMLGHTNISTTQIYAKILPDQVLEAFDQIKTPDI